MQVQAFKSLWENLVLSFLDRSRKMLTEKEIDAYFYHFVVLESFNSFDCNYCKNVFFCQNNMITEILILQLLFTVIYVFIINVFLNSYCMLVSNVKVECMNYDKNSHFKNEKTHVTVSFVAHYLAWDLSK